MQRRTLLAGGSAALLATPAIAQDQRGRILRVVPRGGLGSLDPVQTTGSAVCAHGSYVFDTLYAPGPDLRPCPQMAAGHEVSDDGRAWRIFLREGLTFHDGTPVRAIDCATSLRRWCNAQTPFGQLLAKVVDTWGARDDRTIELKLSRPFPLLLAAITSPFWYVAAIMPEHLARTDPTKSVTAMVGSGPYRFIESEYDANSHAAYEKFDAYVPRPEPPERAAGGKVAHFRRIECHVIPDAATAAAALAAGEVDWWTLVPADLLPNLRSNPNISIADSDPFGDLVVLRFNCLQPPFDDIRLRRAVMRAVVQEDFLRASMGDDTSLWATCRTLWPRGTEYYSDQDNSLMPGNLEAGRAALRDAGYGGQKVVILSATDPSYLAALGEVAADLLRRLGMNVDLQVMDFGTLARRRASREPIENGGWSLFCTSTSGTSADPANATFLQGNGNAGFFGWWSNQHAQDLVDAWVFEPDAAARRRIALELGHLAMTEAGTIPLGRWLERTAFRRTITGIIPGPCPYPWNVRPA